MLPRLAVLTALTVMATAVGMVVASPASAGVNCDGGYHCVFYSSFNSSRHSYFNSDSNFTNDRFDESPGGGPGSGVLVNDEVMSASNSSSGGYYSYYYLHTDYQGGQLFCVRPGSQIEYLPAGQRDLASSMRLSLNNWGGCY